MLLLCTAANADVHRLTPGGRAVNWQVNGQWLVVAGRCLKANSIAKIPSEKGVSLFAGLAAGN